MVAKSGSKPHNIVLHVAIKIFRFLKNDLLRFFFITKFYLVV